MKTKLLIACNVSCGLAVIGMMFLFSQSRRNFMDSMAEKDKEIADLKETVALHKEVAFVPPVEVQQRRERLLLNFKIEYAQPTMKSNNQPASNGAISVVFYQPPEKTNNPQLKKQMADMVKTCVQMYPPFVDFYAEALDGSGERIAWLPRIFCDARRRKCYYIDDQFRKISVDYAQRIPEKNGRLGPDDRDFYIESQYSAGLYLPDGTVTGDATLDVEYYKNADAQKVQANLRQQLQACVDLYEPASDVLAFALDNRPGDNRSLFPGVKTLRYYRDAKKIDFNEARK